MINEITVKVLEFTVDSYDSSNNPTPTGSYTFEGFELPSGEVQVPYESTSDGWYDDVDRVEAWGLDLITSYRQTGATQERSEDDIEDSVRQAAREFGDYAVPESLHKYLEQENAA